jgi:hypothetical protein
MMCTRLRGLLILAAVWAAVAGRATAVVLVNDTWKDGTDSDPAAGDANFDDAGGVNGGDFLIWQRNVGATGAAATNATGDANGDANVNSGDLAVWRNLYGAANDAPNDAPQHSENGVDFDNDLDLESAWFQGGTGTLNPVGPGGPLRGAPLASSASWTTYFTPESAPATLSAPGHQLKVTWVFKPSGVANDDMNNTGQNFRLAVVDSPAANRLFVAGSPQGNVAGETYDGYAMFMNLDQTLRRSSPFSLMKRVAGDNLGFLSASGAWASLIDDGTTGNPGYVSDTAYTYTMTITRNALDGLDIVSRMEGTGLGPGNQGFLQVTYTDASPTKFTFDTFGIRSSSAATTATMFDTSNFQVEVLTGVPVATAVPEPTAAVLTVAALGMVRRRLGRRGLKTGAGQGPG